MSEIKLVTERDLQGKNPLFPSSGLMHEFHLLNMHPDGIWLVDEQHPLFNSMVTTAILIAKTYGGVAPNSNREVIDKLKQLIL